MYQFVTSPIESLLKLEVNNKTKLFPKKFVPQSIFITPWVRLKNNLMDLKQEKIEELIQIVSA